MKKIIKHYPMTDRLIVRQGYVVDAHFIDKIEENKYPGPKCLWF